MQTQCKVGCFVWVSVFLLCYFLSTMCSEHYLGHFFNKTSFLASSRLWLTFLQVWGYFWFIFYCLCQTSLTSGKSLRMRTCFGKWGHFDSSSIFILQVIKAHSSYVKQVMQIFAFTIEHTDFLGGYTWHTIMPTENFNETPRMSFSLPCSVQRATFRLQFCFLFFLFKKGSLGPHHVGRVGLQSLIIWCESIIWTGITIIDLFHS